MRSRSDPTAEDGAPWAPPAGPGSHGHPWDVANAVLFLSSDESSFITGLEMPVDGGTLAIAGRYDVRTSASSGRAGSSQTTPAAPSNAGPDRREALPRRQASSIGCWTCDTTSAPTTPRRWRSPRWSGAPSSPVTSAWLAHRARPVRSSSSAGDDQVVNTRQGTPAPPRRRPTATPRSAHADTRSLHRNAAPSINETTGTR